MIVAEVASPFSIESITAAFAAWLLPMSSTLTIRILSVALNPNRSASDGVPSELTGALARTDSKTDRRKSSIDIRLI
jgi:hypothetical protein